MSACERERRWRTLARAAALKVNLGWLLEKFTPLLLASSILCALLILLFRAQGASLSLGALWPYLAAGVALTLGIAWMRAQPLFERLEDGLVRLEGRNGMKSALTAAHCGVAPWPELPEEVRSGVTWRWNWLVLPILSGLAFVGLSLALPVSALQGQHDQAASEPLAWPQMESWLDQIEENRVVEQEDLDELRDRLAELRSMPEEDWYEHAAMEASDTLREDISQSMRELQRNLESAERSLGVLDHLAEDLPREMRDRLVRDYQEAVKEMGLGGLPLNRDLLDRLEGLDPAQLKQLSPEQLQNLRDQMRKNAQALREAGGEGLGEGLSEDEQELQQLIDQFTQNSGPGGIGDPNAPGNGNEPGQGGITRGPGTAPITLSDEESKVGSSKLEGVTNEDLSRALPGDLLKTAIGEHDIDETGPALQEAGSVDSVGGGGDRVWRDNLLPSEKEILKRYFR
ncbi:MAG TPA: hypothetical protein VMN36_00560 [Verrucomicrobiales bacterium]|nr:hypothetical protein [Verrucomicrobiales bacterium]